MRAAAAAAEQRVLAVAAAAEQRGPVAAVAEQRGPVVAGAAAERRAHAAAADEQRRPTGRCGRAVQGGAVPGLAGPATLSGSPSVWRRRWPRFAQRFPGPAVLTWRTDCLPWRSLWGLRRLAVTVRSQVQRRPVAVRSPWGQPLRWLQAWPRPSRSGRWIPARR